MQGVKPDGTSPVFAQTIASAKDPVPGLWEFSCCRRRSMLAVDCCIAPFRAVAGGVDLTHSVDVPGNLAHARRMADAMNANRKKLHRESGPSMWSQTIEQRIGLVTCGGVMFAQDGEAAPCQAPRWARHRTIRLRSARRFRGRRPRHVSSCGMKSGPESHGPPLSPSIPS